MTAAVATFGPVILATALRAEAGTFVEGGGADGRAAAYKSSGIVVPPLEDNLMNNHFK